MVTRYARTNQSIVSDISVAYNANQLTAGVMTRHPGIRLETQDQGYNIDWAAPSYGSVQQHYPLHVHRIYIYIYINI